jgi:glycosyltransferase involved in cell wall biosynthesis
MGRAPERAAQLAEPAVECADVSGVACGIDANMKVVICINTAWNLVNFRAGLIRTLVAQGYEVVAVAPVDEYAPRLAELGCRYVPLHMDNGGTHPVHDASLLWRFWRLLRAEKPDVFLGYTVKPNVYGSLAAHWLGIPVINNIAGLGAVFIRDGWLVRLVRGLYKLALGKSARVFFQNPDDRQLFIEHQLVREDATDLLPGSGVDLQRFVPLPLPQSVDPGRKFRFLLIARMLRDKGVGEYVEAARVLQAAWPQVEWCLLGFVDVQNPAAISSEQMQAWVNEGLVHYLGVSDDVRDQIAEAGCVVLPSYREGTPRTLLEAAAMARPIITTDAPGCRGVVDDGLTGFLCQPRDAADLAEKMGQMLALSQAQRSEMGLRGRQKMEEEFDEQIVIEKYLSAINSLV